MEYGNNLTRELAAYYADLRRKAEEKPRFYREKLNSDERYVSALNKYRTEKFERGKAKYLGDKNEEKSRAKSVEIAKRELKAIIDEIGVTKSDLTPVYSCNECRDTGRLQNGGKCRCYKNALKSIIFNTLELTEKKRARFSDAILDDRNNLGKFHEKLKTYCEKFQPETSKSLLITGSVGTGKSFTSECIYSAVDETGYSSIFLTACELNGVFLKYHTAPVEEKNFYFELLCGCDLLVIDDLGCEPILKNVTVEYLGMLLTERAARPLPTIINTNLSQNMLLDRYGDRILSRLNDKRHSVTLEIDGEDLRRIK